MSENMNFAHLSGLRFLLFITLILGLGAACTKPQKETTDAGIKGAASQAGQSELDIESHTGTAKLGGAEVQCGPGQGVDFGANASGLESSQNPDFTNYRLAFVVPLDVPLPSSLAGALRKFTFGWVNLPETVPLQGLLMDLKIVIDTRYQFWSESSKACYLNSSGQSQRNCGGIYELPLQEIKIVGIPVGSKERASGGGLWSKFADVPTQLTDALKAAKGPANMVPTADRVRQLMNESIQSNSAPYVFLKAKPVVTLKPTPSLCRLSVDKITLSETEVVCSSVLPGLNPVQRAAEPWAAGMVKLLASEILRHNQTQVQPSIAANVTKAIKGYFGCGQAKL
jgi:hypothetical protein